MKCPKEIAISLAESHCENYTKSRHFGCVARDVKRGSFLFMGSNHPDHHAEELFLRYISSSLNQVDQFDADEDGKGEERKDRY
jgi:hypothetical protein